MKLKNLVSFSITVFIILSDYGVFCMRNLFLPRTGEITAGQNTVSPVAIADNLSNVTNFQSLLGAGRSLAYPFAAGMLLSIATQANENNWKVSDEGFSKVLGIPREEILESYGTLFDTLETDDNVTLSNMLFSFNPKFSPSEALVDTLMTEVREVTWTRETWRETYGMMVEHLSNVTNEKIDRALIPPVIKIGTPFRKATQAVILSTFHYINGWQNPWTGLELGVFKDNPGIPYLKTEGNFLVAEEEDYIAVSVPLEGGSKSIVFVLPHVNITSKYFRNQAEAGEEDDGQRDIVPFPKKWQMRKLKLRIPTFNTTDADQYGEELEEVGMNETFCTIIKDYYGRYPYYLRPMVQVNSLDFNEDYLEVASATGVAVEKFQSLFSIVSGGGSDGSDDNEDDRKKQQQKPSTENLSPAASQNSQSNPTISEFKSSGESLESITQIPEEDVASTTPLSETNNSIPTLSMDRPFLWYLNDIDVGPMFFGTVEILVNLDFVDNTTAETERPPGGDGDDEMMGTTVLPPTSTAPPPSEADNSTNNAILSDIEKFYLWSCRSYTPQTAGDKEKGSESQKKVPSPAAFNFQFEDDDINNAPTATDANDISQNS